MGASTEASEEAVLAVLRRLLVDPVGSRPFGTGASPGVLGSRSPAARRLLDHLTGRGLVELERSEGNAERCRLTTAGRQWLLEKENPRLLLEDLLRATEQASEQLRSLELLLREQRDRLRQQCADVSQVLGRLVGEIHHAPLEQSIDELLRTHERSGSPADCSVVELFEELRGRQPGLTIGQFHDRLRALHEAGQLRLAPWTGPLYELPEPRLALLIGHEVLYYVHRARRNAA